MDPKQQDTYNRVMATPAQNPFTTPDPQGNAPMPQVTTLKQTPPTPTAVIPPATIQVQAPPLQNPLPSPATMTQAIQGSSISTTLQIVYIVAALVFFIVYTIFWIKIFNLTTPLPF